MRPVMRNVMSSVAIELGFSDVGRSRLMLSEDNALDKRRH